MILAVGIEIESAQTPDDWRKRYGPPAEDRYILPDGMALTISYSDEGQTYNARLDSPKPQPESAFDEILDQIVPPADRGKRLRAIGFSNAIAFIQYERVSITLFTASRQNPDQIKSVVISWTEIQLQRTTNSVIRDSRPVQSS